MYRYSFNSVEYKLPNIKISTTNIQYRNNFYSKLLTDNKIK